MNSEQQFFNSGAVTITNARFVAGEQTFAIAGITSVQAQVEEPDRRSSLALMLIGVILFISALAQKLFGAGILGLGLIAAGIWLHRTAEPTYSVLLRTSAGEVKALSSQDSSWIQSIVSALNEAIVYRG